MGDFLAEELEERGWSEADFAAIMGRPTRFVEELIRVSGSLRENPPSWSGQRLVLRQSYGSICRTRTGSGSTLAVDKFGVRGKPPKITA